MEESRRHGACRAFLGSKGVERKDGRLKWVFFSLTARLLPFPPSPRARVRDFWRKENQPPNSGFC